MKHLLFKPLLVLILLIGAGVVQAHAGMPGSAPVAQIAVVPTPQAVLTSYPVETHIYAADAALVPTPNPSIAPTPTLDTAVVPTPQVPTPPSSSTHLTSTPSPKPVAKPAVTPLAVQPKLASAATSSSGYTVRSGKVYDAGGQQIVLHGVNWFGFDGSAHAPHGLWSRNWQGMVSQIKATGFNAVRLPVCSASINGASVPNGLVDYTQNPDLRGLNGSQIMDKIVTEFNAQGIYVLMDIHTSDCQQITNLWYTQSYPETQWIADLQNMAQRYAALPYFLGIDLKNEPQGRATWGTGNQSTDWNLAAERGGNAVLTVNPNLLIFVEGIQDNPVCSSDTAHFAGGSFEPVNCTGLNLPANKTVYSPHVYGPDVYMQPYFSDPAFPQNMSGIWDTQFGFLTNQSKTVIPGEWGGKMGLGNGSALDMTLQNALVNYYVSRGICSSFYWSWNPNSLDTGGILEDDWQTPWPQKMQLLNTYWQSCK